MRRADLSWRLSAARAVLVISLAGVLLLAGGVARPDVARPDEVPRTAWQSDNPYVFAVGDSLLEQCREDFGMGSRSSGYIAWPGATAGDMRGRLEGTGSGWPAWTVTESSLEEERRWFREAGSLVVSLGTNDVTSTTVTEWRRDLEWFMTQARGRPVQWFTIHNPQLQANVDLFNAELRLATDRWPNLTLMDWDRYASANPGILLSDRVHVATYREGCQQGRNRLIQHAAPAGPADAAAVGYWYIAPPGEGPVHLDGWAAAYVPHPAATVTVNVRADWRHVTRVPADQPTEDIWAQTAHGRAFGVALGAEYRGRVICLDLIDQRNRFTSLGCRVA